MVLHGVVTSGMSNCPRSFFRIDPEKTDEELRNWPMTLPPRA